MIQLLFKPPNSKQSIDPCRTNTGRAQAAARSSSTLITTGNARFSKELTETMLHLLSKYHNGRWSMVFYTKSRDYAPAFGLTFMTIDRVWYPIELAETMLQLLSNSYDKRRSMVFQIPKRDCGLLWSTPTIWTMHGCRQN